ncbi:hypothetical protein N4R57_07345 [Rhodobacteraceae bacterium D3-12]|nr:hypothetical protein N4R57_07345 [Rhodobacteraceae bacterium D3-12]
MNDNQSSTAERHLKRAIATVEIQLRALARDLALLHEQTKQGDFTDLLNSGRTAKRARQWIDIAYELEKRLETINTTPRDGDAVQPLDLDDARSRIGCRLDRLRRARCSGRVPERVE